MLGVGENSRKIASCFLILRHILNLAGTPCANREHGWETSQSKISVIVAVWTGSTEGNAEDWKNFSLLNHCCEERTVGDWNVLISEGFKGE